MHATISAKVQEARLAALEAEVKDLQEKLGEHEDAEKIVQRHIKLLHQYNEAKDATQILIGRVHITTDEYWKHLHVSLQLAVLKGTTIRQIHEDLGLDGND